jgi:hypothetical protein
MTEEKGVRTFHRLSSRSHFTTAVGASELCFSELCEDVSQSDTVNQLGRRQVYDLIGWAPPSKVLLECATVDKANDNRLLPLARRPPVSWRVEGIPRSVQRNGQ